jgi:hypothetical protein
MAVSPEISRLHMQEELTLARDIAVTHKWEIKPNYDHLTIRVTMFAHNGDRFVVEIRCDNYKEMPPLFEFIEPDTEARGTLRAYPKSNGDSFFHPSGPCICAPFNRKAYKAIVATGPHQDWQLGDWLTSTANNVQWSNYSKLGDMLGLIQTRLSRPDLYAGRMG